MLLTAQAKKLATVVGVGSLVGSCPNTGRSLLDGAALTAPPNGEVELLLVGEGTGEGISDGPTSSISLVADGEGDSTMGPSECASVVDGLSDGEAVDDGVAATDRLAVGETVAVSVAVPV